MTRYTDFTPSKKFLDTIAHLPESRQARIIDAWQQRRRAEEIDKIDAGLVADGVDTGSFRAHLKFHI